MQVPAWPRRCVALVFAAVFLTGTVLPLGRADADPAADKRAEAAKLAGQIEADNRRVDSLTARFEAAQFAASDLDARAAALAAAVQSARRRIAETQLDVRDIAVTEFIKRGAPPSPVDSMFSQGDLRGVALAQLFADLAVSRTQETLDASKAAQDDYAARMRDLRAEQKKAHDAAAGLRAARAAAEAALAEQTAHLHSVQADLSALVAAELARQQAAREARTRATVVQNALPPRPNVASPRTGPGSGGAGRPAPDDGTRGSTAVAEARRQLGRPYRFGAAGPDSFDCSGLTMWAWRAAGVNLAHYSGAQYNATTHIPLDELRPGDLVFFHSDLSHVGIYVGGGQMIHAPHSGAVVGYASIFSEGSPIYAGRVTG